MKSIFDYSDGDFCYDMGGGMMMDSDGNLMQDMGGGMALDMESGELMVLDLWTKAWVIGDTLKHTT